MIFLKLQHSPCFHLCARCRLKKVKQRRSRELWAVGVYFHPRPVSHAPPPPSSSDTEGRSSRGERQEAFPARTPGTSPRDHGPGALDSSKGAHQSWQVSPEGQVAGNVSLKCQPVSPAGVSTSSASVIAPPWPWQLSAADVTGGSLIWF